MTPEDFIPKDQSPPDLPAVTIRYSVTGETLWEVYGRAERELSKFVGVFDRPFHDPRMQSFEISVRDHMRRKGEIWLWEGDVTVVWAMTD